MRGSLASSTVAGAVANLPDNSPAIYAVVSVLVQCPDLLWLPSPGFDGQGMRQLSKMQQLLARLPQGHAYVGCEGAVAFLSVKNDTAYTK